MRRLLVALAAVAALATPAHAYRDPKLQEAAAKAAEQVAKGRPEQAVRILQKTAAALDTGEAQLALGRLQQRLGAVDEAATAFAAARELGGGDPEVLAAVAGFTLATGAAKDALPLAESAVAGASSCETLATLARVLVRANDIARAKETAEKAFAAAPPCALALAAQGELRAATGQQREAIDSFRNALELDAALLEARLDLVSALVAAGQGDEALSQARLAEKDAPALPEALAAVGLARMAAAKPNDNGAWGEAILAAQSGAAANPRSAVIQHAVGRLFEAQQYPDKALAAYRKALAIDPSYLPARLAVVHLLVAQADTASAAREAEKLAADVPWSGEARFLLGRELLRTKDAARALPVLEKAVALSPGNAEAHALLATSAFFAGKTDQAVSVYRKALELSPDNVRWRADYGFFLGVNDDFDAAVTELKKVVATPGYRDAAGWTNLGWVYRSCRPAKTQEAIAAYKKALEIDPKQEQAALGLGGLYTADSSFDESIAAYTSAVAMEPKLAGEAYDGIAWAYYFKRDMAKARECEAKAKAAGRDDPRLRQQITEYETLKKKNTDELINEQKRLARCNTLSTNLGSKSAGLRLAAVKELVGSECFELGASVDTLVFALRMDESWTVKAAAASALGSLGPKAQKAIPHLKPYARECEFGVDLSEKDIEREGECQRLRSAAAQALLKIQL